MRETTGPLMWELTGEIRSAGPENRPGGLPLGTLPISPHNAPILSALDLTSALSEWPTRSEPGLIVDNYATHKHPKVKRWLAATGASIFTSRQRAPHG